MSEPTGAPSPAPQASPAESGRPAETVTVPSDGQGQTFTQEQVDSIIAKRVSEAKAKSQAEQERLAAEVAEYKAREQQALLDGMKPEEVLEKYKARESEIESLTAFKAGVLQEKAAALRAKAEGLQSETAKSFVLSQIDAGNHDAASAFLDAYTTGSPPKPNDPATPPNNPSAQLGISEADVKAWRAAASSGDVKAIQALKDKHGIDDLRKADQALKLQGK